MQNSYSIKITALLPFDFYGGLHRWQVFVAFGGKNHSKGILIVYCPDTQEQINVLEGRAGYVESAAYRELHAMRGSKLHLIFRRLVKLRLAKPV